MREQVDIDQFRVPGAAESLVDGEPEVVAIQVNGERIQDAEAQLCLAKYATDRVSRRSRYFVRAATDGLKRGKFFDPAADDKELLRRNGHSGRRYYEFTEVSQAAFDLYASYLKGSANHTALLRNAERL